MLIKGYKMAFIYTLNRYEAKLESLIKYSTIVLLGLRNN